MILKRKEKDGIVKAIYSSSNICASVYNTVTNELTIFSAMEANTNTLMLQQLITCVLKQQIVKVQC